jgi:hypothetical protein
LLQKFLSHFIEVALINALQPDRPVHYLSPKLQLNDIHSLDSPQIVAISEIQAGELICIWGGRIVDFIQRKQLDPATQKMAIQVE